MEDRGLDVTARPLRIAQIAPLFESVPPKLYGGTERVAAYLSEELARQGHDVTLFASGDSTAKVKLEAGYPESLRLAHLDHLGPMYHLPMLSAAYDHAERFDIIHSHVDYWSYPFARLVATPTISTMHGRLDLTEIAPVYRHYREQPVVSISDSQRRPLPEVNWVGTVYHGLPRELLNFRPKPGSYLAFLGRMSPEKGPDRAIEVARRAGVPLRMAAKVDRLDREYFETVIKPMLREPGVEFIGEINEVQKQDFLGNAMALLFPIDWPEPFGLVMIEALACGTPVIARPCGSVTEILRDGIGGLLASTTDDLVNAVHRVAQMSRRACRDEFDQRFTSEVMAANYLRLYHRLIETAKVAPRTKASS